MTAFLRYSISSEQADSLWHESVSSLRYLNSFILHKTEKRWMSLDLDCEYFSSAMQPRRVRLPVDCS